MLLHSDGIALDVAIVGLLLLGDGCGVAAVRTQFLPYPLRCCYGFQSIQARLLGYRLALLRLSWMY